MQYFRKVLIGVPAPSFDDDGKPIADPPTTAALQQAVQLASSGGCSLTLMTVLDPPSGGFLSSAEDNAALAARILTEAEEALAAVAESLDAEHVEIQTKVVTGQPWIEICRAVLRDGYDLVMAGTRNVGAIKRLLFGGTGLRLLRNCPCPVWIVKPREEHEATNVLATTQLDEVGQQAVSLAVDGAGLLDAHVHVLHAIEFEPARRLGMNATEAQEYREKLEQERTEALNHQISQTDHRTTPYGVQVLVAKGRPFECVLEAIERNEIDLLIMGTVGRGGLPGALVGNTAEHLLPEISCSILAIKPDDFECPVKLDDA
ncbi:MAG: universal stress protein [Planctomycetaceae bacterium]